MISKFHSAFLSCLLAAVAAAHAWYDPTTRSFLSRDPLREVGGGPNTIWYCGNNPLNTHDPLGLTTRMDLYGVAFNDFDPRPSYQAAVEEDLAAMQTSLEVQRRFMPDPDLYGQSFDCRIREIGEAYRQTLLIGALDSNPYSWAMQAATGVDLGATFVSGQWQYGSQVEGAVNLIAMGLPLGMVRTPAAMAFREAEMGVAASINMTDDAIALSRAVSRMAGEEIAAMLAKPTFAAKGITYEGQIYRAVNPQYADSVLEIGPQNIARSHRYSGPGEGALYTSTSPEALFGELSHYDINPQAVQIMTGSIRAENVLDLTNPSIRNQMGISLESLVGNNYSVTQSLGSKLRLNYSGLLVPSARAPGTSNLILFNP